MPPLSSAAPAYIPMKKAMPWISPPPAGPGFTTTNICMPPPPPPPPPRELYPWPHLAAPPLAPMPFWTIRPPQVLACVPGMHGAFPGAVVPPHAHGAVALSRPAPSACPPRHIKARRRMQRAATGPAAAPSRGAKAVAWDAKEAATNLPSPRSVLVAAATATSPPISPTTTSLPTSFPYQVVPSSPPPATACRLASATTAPSSPAAKGVRPPRKRQPLWLRRRARPASRVQVRGRTVPKPKPRRMFDPTSERTSLMVRNIPNNFTRMRLMNILDEHCSIENEKIAPGGLRSEYDFLYLPIDFRTGANKGYAFVNMTSPEGARRLWEHLNAHRWGFKGSAKTCAVDYADREGRDEFVKHFSGSYFDCHTEEYLPVWFEPPRDGTRPAEGAMHVIGRLARRPPQRQ